MSRRGGVKKPKKDLLAEEYEYVEGFGEIIRKARESMGLSQEELASLVKEKATVIKKIEHEEFHPPLDLARRLEKVLKIRIIQEAVEEPTLSSIPKASQVKETTYTLGDLLSKKGREETK